MVAKIAGLEYRVVIMAGRLFLDSEEFKVIIDHDCQEIRVSSRVPYREQLQLVADAMAEIFRGQIPRLLAEEAGQT